MKRNLDMLAAEEFDVLVIGGGIVGAFAAWDASLRGLSVALAEKADFMSGTSSNSLKVLHGGLRYLQDLRPDLVRMMVRERRAMMRIAPHLVRPLGFVLPTTGWGQRSKLALGTALKVNDMISADRNLGLPDEIHLPSGELLSLSDFMEWFPGYSGTDSITGAAMWYDGQVIDTERYGISVLKSAEASGASLANYVEVAEILKKDGKVWGALVRDGLTGDMFVIKARLVVNASGPSLGQVLQNSGLEPSVAEYVPSLAMNAVIDKSVADRALGFTIREGSRGTTGASLDSSVIFLVPWKGYTVVGTIHSQVPHQKETPIEDWHLIEALISKVDERIDGLGISMDDVRFVQKGLLPAHPATSESGKVRLVREAKVIDHRDQDLEGLISILSVKFSSARHVAERAIDLAEDQLSVNTRGCLTAEFPLLGGDLTSPSQYVDDQVKTHQGRLSRPLIEDLVTCYGSEYSRVLNEAPGFFIQDPMRSLDDIDVLRAKARYAVHEEMAVHLEDVVLRRIGYGGCGPDFQEVADLCAQEMAELRDWSTAEKERQAWSVGRGTRSAVLTS